MSWAMLTIPTADGQKIELPVAQALAVAEALLEFKRPVWHVNDCGCCVSVHENEKPVTGGYVIGRDGGADWVEVEP
jgi:hypothetical protein